MKQVLELLGTVIGGVMFLNGLRYFILTDDAYIGILSTVIALGGLFILVRVFKGEK